MSDEPVYLDHHATTPCHPEVVEAMLPFFSHDFGNPASVTSAHGRRAATALEEARSTLASFLGVRPAEVFFTAGATESNNIVLQSDRLQPGDHIVSTAIEHKSVLAPIERMRGRGMEATIVDVDREGFVDPRQVADAITNRTKIVSVMAANGEIGTIEPVAEIGDICRSRGVLFHSDATQAVGRIAFNAIDLPFHALSISAHKLYGPKGIGALIVRRGNRVSPLIVGGGQEKGLRSGTVNVPGAVGFARAIEIRQREMSDEAARLTRLRNRLRETLEREIPDTIVHGPRELRLPGNLNVTFRQVDAEALMLAMRRFSLSSGAACSSADREPSHVLAAVGVSVDDAMSSIRFGLGRSTTEEEVTQLIADLKENVGRLREMTPRV
jgi:cysteine desulfurase